MSQIVSTCAKWGGALMLSLALFAPGASAPAQAVFPEAIDSFDFSNFVSDVTVGSFHSDVEVREDRSVRVTETLHTVFDVDRHGIFRDIPVIYYDNLGNRLNARFELESVTLNGQPVPYERSWHNGQVRLRIGDPDVYVRNLQVYQITYVMHDVVLFFDDYDEFYWNVTGTEWEIAVNNSTAIIHLPEGAHMKQQSCYTGIYGSREQDCALTVSGNEVRAEGQRYLTVAVGIDKGSVAEPTTAERVWGIVRDNWWGIIPLFLLGWTVLQWKKYGKDADRQTVIPEYDAPQNMNAAAVALAYGRCKLKFVLTAMIVEMAMGGYLEMNVENRRNGRVKNITLKRLKDSSGLDARYAELFDKVLFKGERAEVTLKQIGREQNGGKVLGIIRQLTIEFRRNLLFDKASLRRQAWFIFLGATTVAASFFALGFGLFVAFATFVSGVGIFIFGCLMRRRTPEGDETLRHIEGFYLFIKTAEVHRSEWQQKEGIFEKVLPYAIAFGLAQHWARAFPDLQFEPTWYRGDTPFTVIGFANNVNAMSNRLYTNLSSTPSSSSGSYRSGGGSGGGGFSGGGFGGGGGGSW